MARSQGTTGSTPRTTWSASGISFGSAFTFMVWARCDNSTPDYLAAAAIDDGDTVKQCTFQVTGEPRVWNWWHETSGSTDLYDDTALVTGRWYCLVGRRASSSAHYFDIYDPVADRTASDSDTSSSVSNFTDADTLVVGNSHWSAWDVSMDGAFAEFAVWNGVSLTDAEVASLQAGCSPLLIRPQSLVHYAPLISGTPDDQIGGLSPSETGTWGNNPHPPGIIYPVGTHAPLVSNWGRAVDVIGAAPASAGVVQESYLRLGQEFADLKAGEAFRIRLSRASTQGADSMTDDSELIRAELVEVDDG